MRPIKFDANKVKERIKKLKVVKIKELAESLNCTVRTLFNKLERSMYYTSYNFNRQYISLKEIPIFDENGIWEYEQVRFSKWGNVEETIQNIVHRSSSGISAGEIADILQIQTHNQLLKCRRKEMLINKRYGRSQIYFSADKTKQKHQIEMRQTLMIESLKDIELQAPSTKAIIDILLVMVKHRENEPDKIVKILSTKGRRIKEGDIKWVINEYDIKKTSRNFKVR